MNFAFKLTTSTVSGVEIEEPIGWAESVLTIKRDIEKYHGLFFGYTTSLEFINDGFRYNKKEFDLRGPDGYGLIEIFIDCNDTGDYVKVYQGELDFSSYSDVRNEGCSCTMDVTESTVQVLTVNRQEILTDMEAETSIDGYDISGGNMFDLLMHNYTLEYNGRWFSNAPKVNSKLDGEFVGPAYYWQLKNPICIEVDEIGGMTECLAEGDHFENGSLPSPADLSSLSSIFTAPRSSSVTVNYKISGTFIDDSIATRIGNYAMSFSLSDNINPPLLLDQLVAPTGYAEGAGSFVVPFYIVGSFTTNIVAGWKISFRFSVSNHQLTTGTGAIPVNMTLNLDADNFIEIKEESSFDATVAKSVKLYDAFWKSISNYTGSKDAFYSQLLGYPSAPDRAYLSNGCASYTALTNGYKIRGFPDKKLFVNLTELFDSTDAIFNIGLGFEVQSDNVIRCRVEEKDFFYSNNTLLGIFSDVREIKTSVIKELLNNQFQLGFESFKVEEGTDKLNTNDEFLTQFTWATTSRAVKNTFKKFSKYISSLYIIEYTRRNRYQSNATKESKYDEKNFLIAMNRNGIDQAERNEKFYSVTGVRHSDEAYNLRFNLFSTLLRWSNIFGASVFRLVDNTIKFTFGSLNNDVSMEYKDEENCEGNYDSEPFVTNQNLAFDNPNNDVGKPIYEPILYEFEYPLSFEEFNRFRRYPNGTLIFGRDLEKLTQAFILEVNYKPTEGIADFKLLRSYEQNVSLFFPPLIDIFSLPMGFIIEYSGTMSIWDATGRGTGLYSRFALCNGQNGTPDLRGQFSVTYDERNSDYDAIGKNGGSKQVTLTSAQSGQKAISANVMVNGSPALASNSTLLLLNQMNNGGGGTTGPNVNAFGGATVEIVASNASSPFDNRPNYYVLAKAMLIE